jgi:hypothetical protein
VWNSKRRNHISARIRRSNLSGRRAFSAFTYPDTAASPVVHTNSLPFTARCRASRKSDNPPHTRNFICRRWAVPLRVEPVLTANSGLVR